MPSPREPNPQNSVPPVAAVEQTLASAVAQLLLLFKANNIDGLTINSIGSILSGLRWGYEQSNEERHALIHETAVAQVDAIRTLLLRDSVSDQSN